MFTTDIVYDNSIVILNNVIDKRPYAPQALNLSALRTTFFKGALGAGRSFGNIGASWSLEEHRSLREVFEGLHEDLLL